MVSHYTLSIYLSLSWSGENGFSSTPPVVWCVFAIACWLAPGGFMLALIAATLSVETPLKNGVTETADLINGGEPKTYKLLLDVNVR